MVDAFVIMFSAYGDIRFDWSIDNFKFNFLSRGQLESSSHDTIFLTFIQNITLQRGLSSNFIFAIIARMFCGNHLQTAWQCWQI